MAEGHYKAGIIGLGFIGAADQVSGDALGQRVEDLDDTHWKALASNPRVEVFGSLAAIQIHGRFWTDRSASLAAKSLRGTYRNRTT